MKPEERAAARRLTALLFAQLYRNGLRSDVLDDVRRLPGLRDFVPEPYDADEAAAVHYEIFGLNVFPFASVFLDPEGRLGGEITEEAARWEALFPSAASFRSEAADHMASELELLARASWNLPGSQTSDFIASHVLPWLLPFAAALQRTGSNFYGALARLTVELAVDFAVAVDEEVRPHRDLPPVPNVLEDPGAGIRDIAEVLARPVWSGLWIAQSDLRRLGRRERLPGGFGSRVQVLTNTLRAAAQYDRQPQILDGLQSLLEEDLAYQKQSAADIPLLSDVCGSWIARLEQTASLIRRLREGLRAAGPTVEGS